MKLEIKCETQDYVNLRDLGFFEKDIKVRNAYDIRRMKQSIEKSGFICPLFIWRNGDDDIILDGKTRVVALLELSKEGWEIGQIPVVYVEAESEQEAKEKVLQVNSRYGKITEASFDFFVKDANLNKADFNIKFDTIHFDNIDPYYEKRKEAKEEATRIIQAGNPIIRPAETESEQVTETQSVPSFSADDGEAGETENPQFDFSSQPVQNEIEICCPYCYENFKMSYQELVDLLGE